MQNSVLRSRMTFVYRSQTSPMIFAFKTATLAPELQVSMGPSPHLCFFCIHNSDIMTRINSLYVTQTSPVVLCLQKSVISARSKSLHGSQTLPVVLCMQHSVISTRVRVSMGPRPHQSFCACKTTWLASELLVSTWPSHHLCFLHAKPQL